MYAPINLSEYIYGTAKLPVPAGTTTVPPKGWIGNITDWIKGGVDIYTQIQTARAETKKIAQPEKSTVTPSVVLTKAVPPSTPQNQREIVFPNAAVFLDALKGAQGSQSRSEEKFSAAPAGFQLSPIMIGAGLVVLVLIIVMIGRRK